MPQFLHGIVVGNHHLVCTGVRNGQRLCRVILLSVTEEPDRHLRITCNSSHYMRVEVCKAVQRGLPNARHELQEQRLLLVREGRDHIPECILVLLVLLRVLHLRVGSQVLQIEGVGLAAKQPLKGLLCVTSRFQRHRIEQREVGGDQHVAHARLDPQRRLQDAVAQVELR